MGILWQGLCCLGGHGKNTLSCIPNRRIPQPAKCNPLTPSSRLFDVVQVPVDVDFLTLKLMGRIWKQSRLSIRHARPRAKRPSKLH
jgi:hypothetical protein